ncbi:ArsR/SmtB family transcription factor [Mobilicoccus caccae]|uniref:HTH arsR-type domain-containing protein n=1 Tax=Mobilicoccus caccae TaxID=1859295 RepID=A0ABQ6IY50_9MICO|nr:metalloregulator ArsR/SmtB family transcription factor [Mobilicoccus caccae]GMA42225.1 hypothetical protein GCM10025883_42700 [Mobilicoccus caccae]
MDHSAASGQWEGASALFKTLASPVRIGIVMSLVERPHTVSEFVEAFGVSQPLVSQHLKVLRDHCLVQTRRQGREVVYSLMDDHVAHIVRDAVAHAVEHDPEHPDEHGDHDTHDDRDRHDRCGSGKERP